MRRAREVRKGGVSVPSDTSDSEPSGSDIDTYRKDIILMMLRIIRSEKIQVYVPNAPTDMCRLRWKTKNSCNFEE